MAAFPIVPSRRMAYDDDGTVVLIRRTDTEFPWQELTDPNKAILNDESGSSSYAAPADFNNHPGDMVFIFPELREIDGFYGAHTQNATDRFQLIEVSADTTNGIDGTFTTAIADWVDVVHTLSSYRESITSLALPTKRALRINFTAHKGAGMSFRSIHIYGEISAGQTPDRLLYIDETTGLEFVLPKDYGDVPRGSARDFEFRLKNNSATLTASTIQVTAEDLFGGSGAWYTFNEAGGAFSPTEAITSIGPGASSALLVTRQIIPNAALPEAHAARIETTVTTWA